MSTSLFCVHAAQKNVLIKAVQSGQVQFVEELADADTVNQRDEKTGTTPLHEAVKLKDKEVALEIAKILLNRGADVLVKDLSGCIPSDLAFLSRFDEMNTLLIGYGAPDCLQVELPVAKL